MSRAFYRALERLNGHSHDTEQTKAVLMTGILHAMTNGERDEEKLVELAFSAVNFEQASLAAPARWQNALGESPVYSREDFDS